MILRSACFLFVASALIALPAAEPAARAPGDYPLPPEAHLRDGVPRGELQGPFEIPSAILAGTVHRYWVFVPAQATPGEPPHLLVFHDGQRALNPSGPLRVDRVLENLIAQHDIPPTLGVFITPGNLSAHYPDHLGMSNPDHRAEEYDALSDDYSRFLLEELLPEVAKTHRFTTDPAHRAIGGTSSGAIAAFTVAWRHPDQFRNVISLIGSYVSIGYRPATATQPLIPGGDLYPTLIRKNPIKPLTIFLQDGANDLSNEHGNWFLANQQMLSALEWANANADAQHDPGPRYRMRHVWGDGNHSDNHGGSLLPDILRWLWGSSAPAPR